MTHFKKITTMRGEVMRAKHLPEGTRRKAAHDGKYYKVKGGVWALITPQKRGKWNDEL